MREFQTPANQEIAEIRNNTAHGSDQQSRGNSICVQPIPVSSPDMLDVGDHVVFHRDGYDHHGIITDKKDEFQFEIVEAAKDRSGRVTLICSFKTFGNPITDVSVANYSQRISKNETAKRAKKIYNYIRKHPEAYRYNLFTNNCEHFATYCATGIMYSLQVREIASRGLQAFVQEKLKSKYRDGNQNKEYECIRCENIENIDSTARLSVTNVMDFWDGILNGRSCGIL